MLLLMLEEAAGGCVTSLSVLGRFDTKASMVVWLEGRLLEEALLLALDGAIVVVLVLVIR